MIKSDNINELAKALSVAQASYNKLIKDSENPFFKSKYSDLAACIDAVRQPLADNKLSVIQTTKVVNNEMILETLLMHESGQFVGGEYIINPMKNDPQSVGATISYARRYSLCAILNIAAEDSDAEESMDRKPQTKKAPTISIAPTVKKNEPTYTKTTYSEATIKKVEKLEKDGMKGKECLKAFLPEFNTDKQTSYKAISELSETLLLELITFIENKVPKGL